MLKLVLCSSRDGIPLDKKKLFSVIQGGAVNHGLKCFKYLGPLVLLKHISGLKSTG
jgi:hypothetical protein